MSDILINEYEKGINTPDKGFETASESAGILKYERRIIVAFFSESAELLRSLQQSKIDLVTQAGDVLFIGVAIISLIILIVGVRLIKNISRKTMKQIIFLLEACEDIQSIRK